jgi:hypothetical protein
MRLNGSAIAMHPANKQASQYAATSYLTITVHTAFGARKFGVTFPTMISSAKLRHNQFSRPLL